MYRLEACAVCRVVRVEIETLLKRRQPPARRIGDALIYEVDFCDDCRRSYDKHQAEMVSEGEGA